MKEETCQGGHNIRNLRVGVRFSDTVEKLYTITYPERRGVTAATIMGWADDLAADERGPRVGSLEEAVWMLQDRGLVTFAPQSLFRICGS